MSAKVEIDTNEFEMLLADFINQNAEEIAKQVAKDAKASTAFKDYKGTTREGSYRAAMYLSMMGQDVSELSHLIAGGPNLRKTIRAKKSRFEDGGWIVVASAPHAHLVEFGHAMVTKHGREVGTVTAHPFLRPALDANMNLARQKFGAE